MFIVDDYDLYDEYLQHMKKVVEIFEGCYLYPAVQNHKYENEIKHIFKGIQFGRSYRLECYNIINDEKNLVITESMKYLKNNTITFNQYLSNNYNLC
jgi:hypothetical protein